MSVGSSESIVVEEMTHRIPVTVVVECLEVPKVVFENSFMVIHIHSVLGEHDIKNRKDLDKALKDTPDFSSIKNQRNMINITLKDAKKFVNLLNKQIMYGNALEELEEHR